MNEQEQAVEDDAYEPSPEDIAAIKALFSSGKVDPGIFERFWEWFRLRQERNRQHQHETWKGAGDAKNKVKQEHAEREPTQGFQAPRPRPDAGPDWHNQMMPKKFRDNPIEDEGY